MKSEVNMRKVVLSLLISGLSISGNCFATDNGFANASSNRENNVGYYQLKVKPVLQKAKVNVLKSWKRTDVKFAIGLTTVCSIGVFAYYFFPKICGSLNSVPRIKFRPTYTGRKSIETCPWFADPNILKKASDFLPADPTVSSSSKWSHITTFLERCDNEGCVIIEQIVFSTDPKNWKIWYL